MSEHIPEPFVRLGLFLAIFAVMAVAEWLAPRRPLRLSRARRWTTNLALVATGAVVVRGLGLLAGPLVAVGAATLAAHNGWGVLNVVAVPTWVAVAITLIALDLAVWAQHVASHKVPLLWRLHRMHHADPDIDLSTGVRFHPIEIGLSMLWKAGCVLALGAPPAAVVAFEAILNGAALFNHANVRLPLALDRILRLVVVTPDMHRVHHSVVPAEHDTNYGFNLSIWDRLLGTYRGQPAAGHTAMTIGLSGWQDASPTRLAWCLALPWHSPASGATEPRSTELRSTEPQTTES